MKTVQALENSSYEGSIMILSFMLFLMGIMLLVHIIANNKRAENLKLTTLSCLVDSKQLMAELNLFYEEEIRLLKEIEDKMYIVSRDINLVLQHTESLSQEDEDALLDTALMLDNLSKKIGGFVNEQDKLKTDSM